MKTISLNVFFAAGLLLLPALPLHASVGSILTLDLKCYTQEKITISGATETGKVDIVRIDSKQLLSLLEQQLNFAFPKGSQLKIMEDGDVFVADSKGNALRDVSDYFHAKLEEDERLFDGTHNMVTGQENSQNYFPISFTINLLTLKGTVRGLALEKFSVTTPDKYGVQRSTGQTSSMVNGSGTLNGMLAYYDGSLKLKGQAATIQGQ